jgi:hypothetical protein
MGSWDQILVKTKLFFFFHAVIMLVFYIIERIIRLKFCIFQNSITIHHCMALLQVAIVLIPSLKFVRPPGWYD